MIDTVESATNRAAYILGDPNKRKVTSADLTVAVQMAWERIYNALMKAGVSTIEASVTYTLPANTTQLTPAVAGIANFGEIIRLQELVGTRYVDMSYVGELPQRDAAPNLGVYRWAGEQFNFIGATVDVPLKIVYHASAGLLDEGSLGLDNVLFVLGPLAASIAGPPKGLSRIAEEQKELVFSGDGTPQNRGLMYDFIQPMLRTEQLAPVQWPAYNAGRRTSYQGGRPPLFENES